LTSQGVSTPTWTTPSASVTVSDDTTTAATRYLTFSSATSGSLTTIYTSSTKLQYDPSTGGLSAITLSGSGAGLTSLPAGQLSGTIPTGVLGNSSLYVGTTSVALNRGSASQSLTGISIDGSAGTVAVTDNTASSATWYPVVSAANTGNNAMTTSSTKLSYVPSTGVLTVTGGISGGTF